MTAKPVLVTGATGCLGTHLTRRLLADGHDVVLFKRYGDPLGPLGPLRQAVEIRFGDLTDAASVYRAMRGIGSVYHLAGVTAPLNRLAGLMWQVNVLGAYNVARAALEAKVDRMVHTSSVAAIGYPPDGVTADESFAAGESVAETAYAATKRHGEAVVRGLVTLGLDVVVVNPSAVLASGGDLRFGWCGLVNAALQGKLRAMPSGGTAVCAAADLVDGQLKAMSNGRSGERYILSSSNISYRDLGRLIAGIAGVAPPITSAPSWALGLIGRVNGAVAGLRRDAYRSSVLIPENVELMTRTLYYDQSRAMRELGISQSALEPAIGEMVAWCRQQSGGGDGHGRRQ